MAYERTYTKAKDPEKIAVGEWCVVGSKAKKPKVFIRCHHCKKINDITEIQMSMEYRPEGPIGFILGCWWCRHGRYSLSGTYFKGWRLKDVLPRFKDYLEGIEKTLEDESVRVYESSHYYGGPTSFHVYSSTMGRTCAVYLEGMMLRGKKKAILKISDPYFGTHMQLMKTRSMVFTDGAKAVRVALKLIKGEKL